ncbi:Alpha,alpha-trehalose-phosphate synthase [UDP-forming] 1 [Acorus gramineus]|uniref:Alpha,alpha-trehalose-phosphate synthase [UDP-forming] 1 n=1 Tax=Acorus gramineus TaxID=55184 RepID=A0AAV9AWE2_ACOGR|nr:Alpha,alpha-trehalose-phosphate synthase [UDP-forming] 1 [Acorus gramineus]
MKWASQGGFQGDHMPGNIYNHNNGGGGGGGGGGIPLTRVERLLRERELRKFNRTFHLSDDGNDNGNPDLSQQELNEGEVRDAASAAAALRVFGEGSETEDGRPLKQRLLVVANRLPVSAVRKGEDTWSLEISAGGLVSALLGVKEFEAKWIGWAGVNVPDEIGQKALSKALAEKRCIPVFLDEEIVHQYYNGYCNNILWPLFHYLGLPQEDRLATTRSFQSQFDAYKRANKMFADVVIKHYEEGDVVCFHTYDYARHFVSACTRILGLEGTPEVKWIHWQVMLGVDRLDMIKGIPQKILAFEKFLEENAKWHDKVVLLQIAVPTRTDVPEYQKLTSQVHEIVGRINGRFGTLTAVPIHHLDRSLDFHALCALYAITDIALVTSLRDGMNLVSYEFVACQASKKGVLILSEVSVRKLPSGSVLTSGGLVHASKFAGAAQSLGAGALLVNPWNITEVAQSIAYALDMPADEREKRHQHNYEHVTRHTAQDWAETFGFNATLTEVLDSPGRRGGDQIKEMDLKLHPELKESLTILCEDTKTTVVVLSGSERSTLDYNFGDYNMWLAAENGMFLRVTQGEWMTTMPEHLNMDWVDSVKHVFEYFTERTPRAHFENRETSLVWNYKYADVEFGRLQARDLLQHLWTGPISNAAVDVVQGSRSVEVRSVGVTKGAAIDRILGEIVHSKGMVTPIDYVLCIGHFLGKDEDIYTFFEPDLLDPAGSAKAKLAEASKTSTDRKLAPRPSTGKGALKSSHSRTNSRNAMSANLDRRAQVPNQASSSMSSARRSPQDSITWHEGSSVLDLKGENYFSCSVGRKQTKARYLLNSSDDVVTFLRQLASASSVRHA